MLELRCLGLQLLILEPKLQNQLIISGKKLQIREIFLLPLWNSGLGLILKRAMLGLVIYYC